MFSQLSYFTPIVLLAFSNPTNGAKVTLLMEATCKLWKTPWCVEFVVMDRINNERHVKKECLTENGEGRYIKFKNYYPLDGVNDDNYKFSVGAFHNCTLDKENDYVSTSFDGITVRKNTEHIIHFTLP